jgi:stage IV sporulation protein FB
VFAEPERTRFDLNFRLFGFPVRVHPLFWLLVAIFGSEVLSKLGADHFLVWIAVAFVSILIHELGHGLAFRLFGVRSHLVLHSFGGLAIPWSRPHRRWQRILVSLAGPIAQLVFFGLVFGSFFITPWPMNNPLAGSLFSFLVQVNLGWALLNLLPVWPLDGGQVCEEVCSWFSPWRGREWSLNISIAVAGGVAIYSLACVLGDRQGAEWMKDIPWWIPRGSLWTAILFGILAVQSHQALQQVRWQGSHWER